MNSPQKRATHPTRIANMQFVYWAAQRLVRWRGLFAACTACAALLAMSACSFDNGLPNALAKHLAAQGINVKIERADATLYSRAGYVVLDRDAAVEARIIAQFGLVPIGKDDAALQLRTAKLPGERVAAWGISGRPRALALAGGAQLEYLYVVHVSDAGGRDDLSR
ncbi:MAG: hypothetical protein ACK5UX_06765 [Burkholderiales bacterium]